MGNLSCSTKKGQGYGRHFDNIFSFHVDQHMLMVLTDVYIREIIPYAYFFSEDGKEDTEIYVVFELKKNDKLHYAYSDLQKRFDTVQIFTEYNSNVKDETEDFV
ncbi:unnamed protein product [Coccothraustes coccothraustes]